MDRRWRYLLIVSVVLNIFLVGAAAGFFFSGAAFGRPGPHRPMSNIWAAARALPEPDRSAFHRAIHQQAAALQPQLKAAHQARREAVDLIGAPRYDAKAVADALARARQGESQARATIDAALVDYVGKLPAAERASLAAAMIRGHSRDLRLSGPPGPPPPQ